LAGAWWYVVIYNAQAAIEAAGPVKAAASVVPAPLGMPPRPKLAPPGAPTSTPGTSPTTDASTTGATATGAATAEEQPQEVGLAGEAKESEAATAQSGPQEVTSFEQERTTGIGQVPAHFYQWFW